MQFSAHWKFKNLNAPATWHEKSVKGQHCQFSRCFLSLSFWRSFPENMFFLSTVSDTSVMSWMNLTYRRTLDHHHHQHQQHCHHQHHHHHQHHQNYHHHHHHHYNINRRRLWHLHFMAEMNFNTFTDDFIILNLDKVSRFWSWSFSYVVLGHDWRNALCVYPHCKVSIGQ